MKALKFDAKMVYEEGNPSACARQTNDLSIDRQAVQDSNHVTVLSEGQTRLHDSSPILIGHAFIDRDKIDRPIID